MKKIRNFLVAAAFAVALGGAFAFNANEVQTDYRFPGTNNQCEEVVRPDICAPGPGPVCTIAGQTYYDNRDANTGQCLDELSFND